MFSIGELSRRTQVKVPTIRYYEDVGLLAAAGRTFGNQRRFDTSGLQRLSFIKHARNLGFSIEAISQLITLQDHPDRLCQEASVITLAQLSDVRDKIEKLRALEKELLRISKACDGQGKVDDCYLLTCLADHGLCAQPH